MPTVIDALAVTLGLDVTKYDKGRKDVDAGMKGLREQSNKTAKEMEEMGKRAAGFFSSIKAELIGVLATLGAIGASEGLKSFLESADKAQASLGLMAKNFGMHTQSLQAWQQAAAGVGESANDVNSAFQAIAGGMAEAQIKGVSSFTNVARANGIALQAGESYQDILESIGARMHQLADGHGAAGRQQAMWLASQLGVGGISQMLLLPQGQLSKFLAQLRQLSGVTDQSSAAALKLHMQWTLVQARFTGIKNKVFDALEPVLIRLSNQFAKFLGTINWNRFAKGVGDATDRVVAFVSALFKRVDWAEIGESIRRIAREFIAWARGVDWREVAHELGTIVNYIIALIPKVADFITKGDNLKKILIAIAAIKVFQWAVGIAAVTAGVGGLAAAFGTLGTAIIAAVSYWAGSQLYKDFFAPGKAAAPVGNAMGKGVATLMAIFGNKSAEDAFNTNAYAEQASKARTAMQKSAKDPKFQQQFNEAVNAYMAMGASRNFAIGMAANEAYESHFDPKAVGDNGLAKGLLQWHPDRQAAYTAFARERHLQDTTLGAATKEEQRLFAFHEIQSNPNLRALSRDAPTASGAAMAIDRYSERPADIAGTSANRAQLAVMESAPYIGARGVAAATSNVNNHTSTSTSTSEVNVTGPITITTQAKDANGVAGALVAGVRRAFGTNALIAQANTGMN